MKSTEIRFNNLSILKQAVYSLAEQYESVFVLDSNQTEAAFSSGCYELIAGFGKANTFGGSNAEAFAASETHKSWKFVQLSYGHFESADLCLYEPELLLFILQGDQILHVCANNCSPGTLEAFVQTVSEALSGRQAEILASRAVASEHPLFIPAVSKDTYLKNVERIREDILDGKYYELNYCIGFSAIYHAQALSPLFSSLNAITAAPFSAFIRQAAYTLLCSSPERFLCRRGSRLLSQPIKGTNRRLEGPDNLEQLRRLAEDEKERAENVMIVDLVRNDLSRVCLPGTVRVDELCGTYAYKAVNHLVSSISGELRPGCSLAEILSALFPMGSMTGAPKLEVMKHIAAYEGEERGIYSGCVGYISPDGDFDLNVVIRSLEYRHGQNKLSYKVGSAITYDSLPESEYQECLLKGSRLEQVFEPEA